jgi:hypothetical protein
MAVMDREKSSARTKLLGPISAKAAIKFLCLSVLVYGLLMAAWPVVGAVYSKFYRAMGEVLFGSFERGGVVQFSQSEDSKDVIYIIAFNQRRVDKNGNISVMRIYHNIRYGDYMYTAFLTALIAATPLSLRRRGWALVWGLLLMHVFVVLKIAIMILELFKSEPVSLLILSPLWAGVVDTVYRVITNPLTISFIITFFVWVLVTFRRGDWEKIVLGQGSRVGASRKVEGITQGRSRKDLRVALGVKGARA